MLGFLWVSLGEGTSQIMLQNPCRISGNHAKGSCKIGSATDTPKATIHRRRNEGSIFYAMHTRKMERVLDSSSLSCAERHSI